MATGSAVSAIDRPEPGEEVARHRRPAGTHDRDRCGEAWQFPRRRHRGLQCRHRSLDHLGIVDGQGAVDRAARRVVERSRLLLVQADRGRRLSGHRRGALIDVVAGAGRGDGEHRQAEIGQADVAHAAAEAHADAGEVGILQLGKDDGEAFVHRLRLVAEFLEDPLHRALVEDQVGAVAGRRARDAQAQLLAPGRFAAQPTDQQFDHLKVLRFGRVEQPAPHRPPRVAVQELGELVGAVAVGEDMAGFDLMQDVLPRQHLLGHLAVGDRDEGVELRREVDGLAVHGGEDQAAGANVHSLDGLLLCRGHGRVS